MPQDVEESGAGTQTADATPSASDAENQGSSAEAAETGSVDSSGGVQSGAATDNPSSDIENADVPPELAETKKNLLRDYHEKMARLKDERGKYQSELDAAKKDSAVLQRLFQQEWFKKAMDSEKSRKAGAALNFELTDEQFDSVRTDKRAFLELTRQVAEKIVEDKYGDRLSELGQTTSELRADREFDRVASRYGEDFTRLNDEGALDPYLKAGFDYDTAYAKASLAARTKGGGMDGAVRKEAERLLMSRKQQTVEKTGAGKVGGSKVIKARNFSDAISKSLEALMSGDKDFKLAKE